MQAYRRETPAQLIAEINGIAADLSNAAEALSEKISEAELSIGELRDALTALVEAAENAMAADGSGDDVWQNDAYEDLTRRISAARNALRAN